MIKIFEKIKRAFNIVGKVVNNVATKAIGLFKFKSLKMKFVAFNFITILLIIIMSMIYSIYQFNNSTKNNLHETLKSQVAASEVMLNNKISYLDAINESIVKDNSVVVPLKLEIDEQIVDYFTNISKNYKEIDDVIVVNDERVLYKTTDKYMNLVDKIKVDAKKQNKSISGIVYTQQMSIVNVKPIYSGRSYEDKTLIGVILVAHNLSKDYDFISSMGKSLDANIALYQNNKMIGMSDKNGKLSKPTKNEESMDITKIFKAGSYFTEDTVELFGKSSFAYFKTINDLDKKPVGVMAALESSDKFNSEIVKIVLSMAAIGGFGLGIGLTLILIITSILTKPIISLTKSVQTVQSGDLTVEVQCNTNDEIEILSTGFNDMIKNLRDLVKMIIEKSNTISNINTNLSESYLKVNSHMIKIDNSVVVLNKNFIENSASINNVNAGVEDMAESSQDIVSYSNETQTKSKNTVKEASKVMTKVEDAKNSSKEVVEETHLLVNLITQLENVSKRIGDIVSVITGITSQTTLLSLNAAIEAARAGEYGTGFAVVAKEISSLAASTKQQAESINNLNKDIMTQVKNVASKMTNNLSKVESSFEIVNELGSVLENLTSFIQNLDKNMDEIVMSAEKQAACSEQITGSMDTIADNTSDMTKKVTEITNVVTDEKRLVENTLSDINDLQQSFEELKRLVDNFKV